MTHVGRHFELALALIGSVHDAALRLCQPASGGSLRAVGARPVLAGPLKFKSIDSLAQCHLTQMKMARLCLLLLLLLRLRLKMIYLSQFSCSAICFLVAAYFSYAEQAEVERF